MKVIVYLKREVEVGEVELEQTYTPQGFNVDAYGRNMEKLQKIVGDTETVVDYDTVAEE